MKIRTIIGLLVAITFFGFGCKKLQSQLESKGKDLLKSAIKITATALWSEVQRNKVVATKRYAGRMLEVTGKVVGAHTDTKTVQLKGGADDLDIIQCPVGDAAGKAKVGQNATLKGRFGRASATGIVYLISCSVE